MSSYEDIARQFTTFYYQTFDTDRQGLAGLYREHSLLTFETANVTGSIAITEKLLAFPFQKVQHQIATLNAQPLPDNQSIMVLVTGALLVDEEQRPMSFVQCFTLLPENGSYYVFNDVFRLIYAA